MQDTEGVPFVENQGVRFAEIDEEVHPDCLIALNYGVVMADLVQVREELDVESFEVVAGELIEEVHVLSKERGTERYKSDLQV